MKKIALIAFLGSLMTTAFAQTDQADALIKEGKYSEALPLLEKAIAAKPNDDMAYTKLAEANLGLDLYATAMESLDKAIDLNPKNAQAYYRRAQLMQFLERADDCLKDISEAIKIDPKPEFFYYRGSLFLAASLNEQAIGDFTDAIGKGMEKADVYHNRSIASLQAGRVADATADCEKAIQLDPQWAEPYAMHAQLRLISLDLDGACADGKKSLDLLKQPLNDTLLFYCNHRDYGTYMMLGVEFEQKEFFEAAAKAYGKALQAAPDSVQLYVSRGAMYQNLKQYDKAEADYKTAEAKGVTNELLYYNWGLMRLFQENYAGAKTCFDKVLLTQTSPNLYFQRGYCSKKIGKLDEAYTDFSKAIELDSAQYAAYGHRAYIEISRKNFAQAKADAEQSIALYPEYGYGYLMRGQAKYYLKEEGACADFKQADEMEVIEAKDAIKTFCK